MSLNPLREVVVREAQSWIKTPYHSNADVKGAGVDCGMLLVRVFVDTGCVPPFDPRPYPPQWNFHQKAEKYMAWVRDRAIEVPGPDDGREPLPGDIVLFRYGLCFAHGGIVQDWPVIIHAYGNGPYQVLPQDVTFSVHLRRMNVRKFFTLWPEDSRD